MSHQISIEPADQAGVHIGDLNEVVDPRITGSANPVDHLPHPRILDCLSPGMKSWRKITVIPRATYSVIWLRCSYIMLAA